MEHTSGGQVDTISRSGSAFCSLWKCWAITALSLVTLFLLFQPWLVASGPYGDAHSDAFGRMEGTIPALRTVGHHPVEGLVSLSGLAGVLIGLAALLTLAGVQLYRRTGIGLSLVIAGNTANAVFVSGALLYLNGKAPEFRAMAGQPDELKAAFGEFVNSLLGDDTVADPAAAQQATTAGLTSQALICGLVAVVSAVIAVTIRKRVAVVTVETGVLENLVPAAVHATADLRDRLPGVAEEAHQLPERAEPPAVDDELRRVREADRPCLPPGAERPRRRGTQPVRVRPESRPARRSRPRRTTRVPAQR